MADFSELDRLSIGELRARRQENDRRLQELDVEYSGLPFPDDVRAEFAGRKAQSEEIDARVAELETRHRYLERQMRDPRNVERELTEQDRRGDRDRPGHLPDPADPRLRAGLSRALHAIDRCGTMDGFDNAAAQRVEKMLRTTDKDGLEARYLAAVGDSAYERAFHKVMRDQTHGHLSFTPDEAEAMRQVRLIEAERAMGEGSGGAGQFGLPLTIDPTIILTNVGALGHFRNLARVETISTFVWKGISSDGVVASFSAEATEVTDASPSLLQPTITPSRGITFVPYSWEIAMDYPSFANELMGLLNDAKLVLEAGKFATGAGGAEPVGLLTIGTAGALTTTQRVQSATTSTLAYADWWTFKQAIPVRFLADSTVVWNPITGDSAYQLSPAGSTTLALLMPEGRDGPIAGIPTASLSTLATGAVTGTKISVAGSFKKGMVIVDRLGASISTVPVLFGAGNRFPTGQSGMVLFWRTGCTAIGAGSAAGCPLRYLEIK